MFNANTRDVRLSIASERLQRQEASQSSRLPQTALLDAPSLAVQATQSDAGYQRRCDDAAIGTVRFHRGRVVVGEREREREREHPPAEVVSGGKGEERNDVTKRTLYVHGAIAVICWIMLCKNSRQTNLPSFRNCCNNALLESVCFLYVCLVYAISWFIFFL